MDSITITARAPFDCVAADHLHLAARAIDDLLCWSLHLRREDEVLAALQDALVRALAEPVDARAGDALQAALRALAEAGDADGALADHELQQALEAARLRMVEGWPGPVVRQAVRGAVDGAYQYGRERGAAGDGLGVESVVDALARDFLRRDTLFWIGRSWDNVLGAEISEAVRKAVLEQGGSRAMAAEVLRERLNDRFPERSRDYWRLVADAATTRALTFGEIESYRALGVTTYGLVVVDDARTSTICQALIGRTFQVAEAVKLRDRFLAAQSADDAREIMPWVPDAEVERVATSDAALAAAGVMLPPFHGRCRTTLQALSFASPSAAPTTAPATVQLLGSPDDQALVMDKLRAWFGPSFDPVALGELCRLPEGYGAEMVVRRDRRFGDVVAQCAMRDAAGERIGNLTITLATIESGRARAHLDFIAIDEAQQGNGLGVGVIRGMLRAFKAWGVEAVDLDAAWVGRYVWAKLGWQWDATTAQAMRSAFQAYMEKSGVPKTVAEEIAASTAARPSDLARAEFNGVAIGRQFLLDADTGQWSGSLPLDDNDPGFQVARRALRLDESRARGPRSEGARDLLQVADADGFDVYDEQGNREA